MNALLGLNGDLLQQADAVERAGYYTATRLFLVVTIMSILSNGYFGYLFLGTWWAALIMALLVGFIHFSVLRISLITLMTKPIIEKASVLKSITVDTAMDSAQKTASPIYTAGSTALTSSRTKKLIAGFKVVRQLNLSSVMRFVFVGLIAITICIPLSTIFFHSEAIQIESSYRNEMLREYSTTAADLQISAGPVGHQLEEAHYPFVIFETLWKRSGYRLLVFLFLLVVYLPLFALARLRYGKSYRYADLCREAMRKEILIDYHETIEQSQYFLNKEFPSFHKKLEDLTAFTDPPFKYEPKSHYKRWFGTSTEFRQFMRTR